MPLLQTTTGCRLPVTAREDSDDGTTGAWEITLRAGVGGHPGVETTREASSLQLLHCRRLTGTQLGCRRVLASVAVAPHRY